MGLNRRKYVRFVCLKLILVLEVKESAETILWISKACYSTANLTGHNLLVEKSNTFMSRKRKITSEEQIFVPKRNMLQKRL